MKIKCIAHAKFTWFIEVPDDSKEIPVPTALPFTPDDGVIAVLFGTQMEVVPSSGNHDG